MKMIDKWLEMKLIENADQDEPSSQDRVNGNKSHQGSSVPDGKAKAAAPGAKDSDQHEVRFVCAVEVVRLFKPEKWHKALKLYFIKGQV